MIVPFSEVLLHTVIDMWRQERFREDENRNGHWASNVVQEWIHWSNLFQSDSHSVLGWISSVHNCQNVMSQTRIKVQQTGPMNPLKLKMKKGGRKSRRRHGYQRLLHFAQFGVPTIYVIVVVIIILIGLFNVYKMS